jgi:hypothetical protein
MDMNKYLYRRRQAIVEHPYGIIKRQWGFSYIMTKKSIERASADIGLIFIAYNLRRIMNIIGQQKLKELWMTVIFIFRACEAYFKAISRSNFFITRKILLFFNTRISILFPDFNRVLRLEIAFKDGF